MSLNQKRVIVKQEDLRRLMKNKTNCERKRIESPFAKYNSLDQLVCSICNNVVKNEKLWTAHVLGKQHKDNLTKSQDNSSKRTISFPENGSSSKIAKLSNDDPECKTLYENKGFKTPSLPPAPKRGILKNKIESNSSKKKNVNSTETNKLVLSSNYCSDADEDDEDSEKNPNNSSNLNLSSKASTSSPSSSDNKTATTAIIIKSNNELLTTPSTKENETEEQEDMELSPQSSIIDAEIAGVIPEGFFDDPKMDAKARNVTYRDKMEAELELFEKAMKQEESVSEALVEEDDELRDEQRNLNEIDEQIARWARIESLAKRKKSVVKNVDLSMVVEIEDDDDSDECDDVVGGGGEGEEMNGYDIDRFLDWRNKFVGDR